jgi:nicotinate-nucleotide adenylyltransferase
VLVGTSGALDPALARGAACVVHEVRTLNGQRWLPTSALRSRLASTQERHFTVLSVDKPVFDPAAKRTLWTSTAATLVDMESAAFAAACEHHYFTWAVVRGISDAAADKLPRECVHFLDSNGRTRLSAVLRAIVRRPKLIFELLQLRRTTELAMRAASFDADSFSCLEAPAFASADRPLLLYGGSFDPPHARHATMLADAMRALRSPCAVVMPAAINPLKSSTPPAPADARHAMCVAAFDENAADFPSEVRVSTFELAREGPSYTIDTLHAIFDRYPHLRGATRLLIGSDAIRSIERWRAWREILSAAPPAIVIRPPDDHASIRAFLREFGAKNGFADAESWLLPLDPVELSSTDVRAAIARGERPAGLADGVWREITARGLYGFGSAR